MRSSHWLLAKGRDAAVSLDAVVDAYDARLAAGPAAGPNRRLIGGTIHAPPHASYRRIDYDPERVFIAHDGFLTPKLLKNAY